MRLRRTMVFVTSVLLLSIACTFGKAISTPPPTMVPPTPGEVAAALQPTMTPVPPLAGGGGCSLNAAYVADVTIPDNTVVAPGASFTKVWRVRNSGTCTWEAGTQLVFVDGEPMTSIGALPVPAVAPGATTDISVEMVAPTAPGTYKSVWQLQSPEGQLFGNRIYAQIVVPEPTPQPSPTVPPTPVPPTVTSTPTPWATVIATLILPTVPVVLMPQTLTLETASRGQVEANATSVRNGNANVGDVSENRGLQAFLTYDLSALPSGATLTALALSWPNYDTLGDPFGALGCVRVYLDDYGTLDPGDYTPPPVSGAVGSYCSTAEIEQAADRPLSSVAVNLMQHRLNDNITVLQLRLQFDRESDGDGVSDVLRSGHNQPYLIVSYNAP